MVAITSQSQRDDVVARGVTNKNVIVAIDTGEGIRRATVDAIIPFDRNVRFVDIDTGETFTAPRGDIVGEGEFVPTPKPAPPSISSIEQQRGQSLPPALRKSIEFEQKLRESGKSEQEITRRQSIVPTREAGFTIRPAPKQESASSLLSRGDIFGASSAAVRELSVPRAEVESRVLAAEARGDALGPMFIRGEAFARGAAASVVGLPAFGYSLATKPVETVASIPESFVGSFRDYGFEFGLGGLATSAIGVKGLRLNVPESIRTGLERRAGEFRAGKAEVSIKSFGKAEAFIQPEIGRGIGTANFQIAVKEGKTTATKSVEAVTRFAFKDIGEGTIVRTEAGLVFDQGKKTAMARFKDIGIPESETSGKFFGMGEMIQTKPVKSLVPRPSISVGRAEKIFTDVEPGDFMMFGKAPARYTESSRFLVRDVSVMTEPKLPAGSKTAIGKGISFVDVKTLAPDFERSSLFQFWPEKRRPVPKSFMDGADKMTVFPGLDIVEPRVVARPTFKALGPALGGQFSRVREFGIGVVRENLKTELAPTLPKSFRMKLPEFGFRTQRASVSQRQKKQDKLKFAPALKTGAGVFQRIKMDSFLMSPKYYAKTADTTRAKTATSLRLGTLQDVGLRQRQIKITMPKFNTIKGTRLVSLPTYLPRLNIPMWNPRAFRGGSAASRGRKKYKKGMRRAFVYSPSLAGAFLNIRVPRAPKGQLTGLEIRGLLGRKRRRK